MALFPCAQGRHRYPGQQRSVYAQVLNGELRDRAKLRLCGPHFFAYVSSITEVMRKIDFDAVDEEPEHGTCLVCGVVLELRTHPIALVTAYDKDGEPQQFTAPVCDAEVAEAIETLTLDHQERPQGTLAQPQVQSVKDKKK